MSWGEGLAAWLPHPALRAIGKYSYSMYICHLPTGVVVAHFFKPLVRRDGNPGANCLLVVLEILLAVALAYATVWVTWRAIENPFQKLKRYFEAGPAEKAPAN